MKQFITTAIRQLIRIFGIDIVRYQEKAASITAYPPDFSKQNIRICDIVRPYTMTSPERVNALIEAVRYVVANKIDGAMVECGVWRGGSAMAMALTLKELCDEDRELYLYDTFSGMTTPIDVDRSIDGCGALEKFSTAKISENVSSWCLSPLEEVRKNIFSMDYPKENFHFIKGKVEDTIPGNIPYKISILRLDTDWYESTKHELTHLFPLLEPKGVLIIDDYGQWKGARKAVDEYISEKSLCLLLNRIDYSGRIAINLGGN